MAINMEYITIVIGILNLILIFILLFKGNKKSDDSALRNEITTSIKTMADMISSSQRDIIKSQNERIEERLSETNKRLEAFESRLNANCVSTEAKLEKIRETLEQSVDKLRRENSEKLEKMRETVDEKLQKTLEDRIGKSFKTVSERLEEVYKGLGEMKSLASGVGDLKKVLSNVKTRGILGEVQLGSILEQFLSPEQYETNFSFKKDSRESVEYAVKLPGRDEGTVYLPIDAKFPVDVYSELMDAYDSCEPDRIKTAKKELEKRIKSFAKDISSKYIVPPVTTDFAIMFLPTEGLYAEVINLGLIEVLQRDYKINIAGPTTITAFLQSLRMGFKTLAIEKRSGEVFDVLSAVKTEFENFGGVIQKVRDRLRQADTEFENLVGVRTRAIQRKLKNIATLTPGESTKLLNDDFEE